MFATQLPGESLQLVDHWSLRSKLITETMLYVLRARRSESRLTDQVLGIEGMSGSDFRHFINNLVRPKCHEPGKLDDKVSQHSQHVS